MVLRYDGTTGAFLSTLVTPDSGGLRLPPFHELHRDRPDDAELRRRDRLPQRRAAQSQSATATPAMSTPTPSISRGGPLPASSPSGGDRFGLASLPDPMWTTPPREVRHDTGPAAVRCR